MLGEVNNFYLISLCILITCLLDNVQIFYGEMLMLITSGSQKVNVRFVRNRFKRILSLSNILVVKFVENDLFALLVCK